MEIDYIREFVVLAETGNFLEAADRLYISQSSLSRHIKKMEEDLGASLFDRTTRKVELNKYGRLFLPYAREISRQQLNYTTAFYNQLQGVSGTLTVGSVPVMAPYNITDVLASFQNDNKNFTLNVVEGDSSMLLQMLRQNQCDFAFIRETDDSSNEFAKIPYSRDTMAAIFPADHPLAHSSAVTLEELHGETFLLLAKNTLMHDLCISACEKAGYSPKVVFTGHRHENIIDMVSKGMGIALLMKKPASFQANPNISIVDITPSISTSLSLAYNKKSDISVAAKHFLSYIKPES